MLEIYWRKVIIKGKNFSCNNTGKRKKSDFYETPYILTKKLIEVEYFEKKRTMIIKSIKLKNFKCFQNNEFNFTQLNFIQGKNGLGKTTMSLEAILFALFGYTPKQSLSDLPTRNKAKSCTVIIEIKHNNKLYRIERSYPSKLKIFEDNKFLKFNNAREGQGFIDNLFCTREQFLKFHTIDKDIGSNFLEEGQVALKRILFSNTDEIFNNWRDKLNSIKKHREVWNKDNLPNQYHYPSENRIDTLEIGLQELENKLKKLIEDLKPLENEHQNAYKQQYQSNKDLDYWNNRFNIIKQNKQCYACKRELSDKKQKEMLNEIEGKQNTLEISLQKLDKEVKTKKEQLDKQSKEKENIRNKVYKVNRLLDKLNNRLKTKEYKYTNKDILIVKKAIEELNKLSSYYITKSIENLEPIINSVLEKINFKIKFSVDSKGKFEIILIKDDIEYTYKDLSTGQKLLLQIAFKLALLLEKNEINTCIIADEGLSNLDEDNLLHVLEIFRNYPYQLIGVLHRFENIPSYIKVINLNKEVE